MDDVLVGLLGRWNAGLDNVGLVLGAKTVLWCSKAWIICLYLVVYVVQ